MLKNLKAEYRALRKPSFTTTIKTAGYVMGASFLGGIVLGFYNTGISLLISTLLYH